MTEEIKNKINTARKRVRVSKTSMEKVASSAGGVHEKFETKETTDDKIAKLKEELYGKDVARIMARAEKRSGSTSPLTSEFMKEKPSVLVSDGTPKVIEREGSSLEAFSRGVAKAIAEFRKEKQSNTEKSAFSGKKFFSEVSR